MSKTIKILNNLKTMVPLVGLEPTLSCPKWILNPSRLPVSPQWLYVQIKYITNILIKKLGNKNLFKFILYLLIIGKSLTQVSFASLYFLEDKNSGIPKSLNISAGLSSIFCSIFWQFYLYN